METTTRLAVGFAALATALAAAGCSASGTAALRPARPDVPAPNAVASPTPSRSAAAAGAPAPASTPRPSSKGTQRCHTSDLTGHVEGHGAGAGQRYAALGLTNTTGTTCSLYGYPGLQLVDAHGSRLPTLVRRDTGMAPTLVLVKPGQTMWASLHWTVVPADDEEATHCAPDPTSLRVIPPDETTQLTMTFDYRAICQHGAITVGAFVEDRPVDG